MCVWFCRLEAFYSIFTTEQQDHVKSVEYLRNNSRPLQDLGGRLVYKSAVENAWKPDVTGAPGGPHGTEASRGKCWVFLGGTFLLHLSCSLTGCRLREHHQPR